MTRETLIKDILSFLKTELLDNIDDPIANKRSSKSLFVATSYPQSDVQYPCITLKCKNFVAKRAGMQTTLQDITLSIELRIWARNQKEKDAIFAEVNDLLAREQFTINGSVNNDFHNFNVLSGIEIDEEGENTPKSRILQLNYQFYNI